MLLDSGVAGLGFWVLRFRISGDAAHSETGRRTMPGSLSLRLRWPGAVAEWVRLHLLGFI